MWERTGVRRTSKLPEAKRQVYHQQAAAVDCNRSAGGRTLQIDLCLEKGSLRRPRILDPTLSQQGTNR
jgi:hypothetical protein